MPAWAATSPPACSSTTASARGPACSPPSRRPSLAGAIVGYLGFRFSLAGVYFALLTIAFSEFTRLAFDHWEWAGGSGGLFLKVDAGTDIVNLRGGPLLFYYVILALAAGAFVLCRALLESRLGRYWLAIREDAEAAQAVGVPVLRCKMIAIVISAALTALAGVWNAFYYNNLFPETAFAMGRSIEITLAPIIGGLGTLFGPIVGAVVLTGLGEAFTDLGEALGIPGIKQIFYGLALLVIVMYRPAGVWPWLAGKLGFGERRQVSGARLDLAGVGKSFRGLRAVHDVSFSVPAGAIHALIGPNGAGKTTIFNMIAGVFAPDAGTVSLDGKVISGLRPDRVCDAGIGRTFQLVKPFKGLSVLENVTVGALHRKARPRRGARQRVGDPVAARPPRPPPSARREPDPARPQAAGSGARARHRAQAAAARRGDGGPAADRGRRHGGVPARAQRAAPASPSC